VKTIRVHMRRCAALVPILFVIACASAPRDAAGPRASASPAGALPAGRPATVADDIDAMLADGGTEVAFARVAAMPDPGWSRPPERVSAAADQEDLAKKTQNPVADMISLPFQNNFNFGVGPDNDLQYVLNIQPVWPFKLTEDWNLITRTILPVIYQPELAPGFGDEFGLGDTLFTGFLSPRKPGKLIWGAGPAVLIPTSTDESLGVGQWGLGPSGVVLTMQGPWVYGALVNNVWSFEGDYNAMLIQPFINYNFPSHWYVCSSPIVTANWEADSDNQWTVPIGGGAGKVFHLGKQPVNCQAQVFYNLETPDGGPNWQLRIQFQLLFPKK